MHDKYWLLVLAVLIVLALYLRWWPRGRPGRERVYARALWLALAIAILTGAVQLITYPLDTVMGSPRYRVYVGAFFAFWGALAVAGLIVARAVYRRFVR